MAYAALTSLARVIDQILPQDQLYVSFWDKEIMKYLHGKVSLSQDQILSQDQLYVSFWDKEQMKSLHEKVVLLQEFLEYISLRPPSSATDVLESRIRDTAHKMEDTIELVILTKPSRNSGSDVQLPEPYEFSSYLKDIHVLLEEAMEMKQIIDNKAILEPPHSLNTTISSREAPGSKGTKVGLDRALSWIMDQVTRHGSTLRIVPITGMGGIGKTTLARAFYEAPYALHHFDFRFWVTVSQEYKIQEILRGILPEAQRTNAPDEQLIEYVHKHLKGRRYLIVFDDMWEEKLWDRVRNALPDDNKGSRIILTTRSSRLASYVGSTNTVHEMQFLSEDQSWYLLQQNVYGQECCSNEFEDSGRMIARNCKGLPLAVVVIAGILKFNKTRDYWKQIARNTEEKVTTSNDHLFEILSWSYTRLPPHLKSCFLYMGTYKEDDEIPTKELVRLWAAEGFLKPKQSRSMEEVAEECLEELVKRSLVLVTKRWYHGKIKTCSVHDIVREVSIRKAEEEKFHYHFEPHVDKSTYRNLLAVQRRVSISYYNVIRLPHDTFFVATHSLNCYSLLESTSVVQCFKLLRVLNKASVENDDMLETLCTLTNLRYLHFVCEGSRTRLKVPISIFLVWYLETIFVSSRGGSGDVRLVFPKEIWTLQRLRHIVMTRNVDFLVPAPNQGCPSLQTLSRLGNTHFTQSFAERIPNLKLKYTGGDHYTMDNLQYLHQRQELSIHCNYSHGYDGQPTNFVFPRSLKILSLEETKIPLENISSTIGLLPNLKVLKLKTQSVEGQVWKPNEGEFLQLEHLKMKRLSIRFWGAESIHFLSLRKLVIFECFWLY